MIRKFGTCLLAAMVVLACSSKIQAQEQAQEVRRYSSGDAKRFLGLVRADGLRITVESTPREGSIYFDYAPSEEDVIPHLIQAIGQYANVAPKRSVDIFVHLLEGTHEQAARAVPPKLSSVVEALRKNFLFLEYGYLDTLHLRLKEDSSGQTSGILEGEFPYSLEIRNVALVETEDGAEVQLSNFSLSVQYPYLDPTRGADDRIIMQKARVFTDLDIGSGQTVVVGKMSLSSSPGNALFVVVNAQIAGGTQRAVQEQRAAEALRAAKLARRAAEFRTSSANNLKQLGLSMKMFANESRGRRFPPLSSERGQLAMDSGPLYPEYLSDPNILISPAHPKATELLDAARAQPRSAFRDHSYWYLGYTLPDEETGLAFVEAFRSHTEAGLSMDSAQGKFHALREGVERFQITDINNPAASALAQSTIPVMIERPGLHRIEGSRGQQTGSNVLFMDGHVVFYKYPGKYPMTERFIKALESLDDLKD